MSSHQILLLSRLGSGVTLHSLFIFGLTLSLPDSSPKFLWF